MPLEAIRTIADLRAAVASARRGGNRIACVPTMGALHAGHASLIRAARAGGGYVVVTIFVNPAQFGPNEDYERYPRRLPDDLRLSAEAGANLVFAPGVEELYPRGAARAGTGLSPHAYVEVPGLSDILEGESRPGHFRGVATVVLKLFNIVQPDVAYFGQKDAQQVAVIRRLIADLNVPTDLVACPTEREADGLAMSSRNAYLTPEQRRHATILFRALAAVVEMTRAGERDVALLRTRMVDMIESTPGAVLDYAAIVDAQSFHSLPRLDRAALALLAVRFGATRLIDNTTLLP